MCETFSALLLKRALFTLTTGRFQGADVVRWLDQNVRAVDPDVLHSRSEALGDITRSCTRRPSQRGTGRVVSTPATPDQPAADGSSSSTHVSQPSAQPATTLNEDTESLYEPPESLYAPPGDSDSDTYVSPAVSEGLGSLGELEESDGTVSSHDYLSQ